jgi:hypothetical protein
MLLGSQNSQFLFLLPYAFFPTEVEEKYDVYRRKNRLHYAHLADYVNSQIKSITHPGITVESSTQLRPFGKVQSYKAPKHEHNMGGNSFSIVFKDADSHVLYMIMQDVLRTQYRDVDLIYSPTASYYQLDMYGDAIYKIDYTEIYIKNISGMTFNYADQKVENKEFTVDFHYNGQEVYWELENSLELPAILMIDNTWGEIQENKTY